MKNIKPVKAWAICHGNTILVGDKTQNIFRTKMEATRHSREWNHVVQVLITPIINRPKR
jgi:hypothetical protein